MALISSSSPSHGWRSTSPATRGNKSSAALDHTIDLRVKVRRVVDFGNLRRASADKAPELVLKLHRQSLPPIARVVVHDDAVAPRAPHHPEHVPLGPGPPPRRPLP